MAELSYPWGVDASDAAAADSRLYQTGWRELVGGNLPDGIVFDRSNGTLANTPLYVSATGTNTVISIAPGSAVVQGALYDNTTVKTIDVATIGTQPSAGQSRTDSVILKYDPTATPANSRLSIQLKAGTPATTGSQVSPTLTKSPTGVWEVEIARVTRAASTNVVQSNISQRHPHPVAAVQSVNAPANPFVNQLWYDANYSCSAWTGTAWKYIGGGQHPMCIAYNSVQPSVSTGNLTNVALNGEIIDTDNMHTSTNSAITCNTPGLYKVWGCVAWDTNGSGQRGGLIKVNDATYAEGSYTMIPPSPTFFTVVTLPASVVRLDVGDYVKLQCYQSSGSGLTLFTSTGVKSFLAAEWIMP